MNEFFSDPIVIFCLVGMVISGGVVLFSAYKINKINNEIYRLEKELIDSS